VLLLALDTSTPAVTVALHDGSQVVAESTVVDARRHSELLAPALTQVLAQAGAAPGDLTQIAVGVGPGPFTGLRVGVVTALALGCALELAVLGVCSQDALAHAAVRDGEVGGPFAVVTDARRREVYWARYDRAGVRVRAPQVDRPAVVAAVAAADGLAVLGPATELYDFAGARQVEAGGPLSAGALAQAVVAGRVELLPPRPLYLRRPDATPPGERKRVLA
jgi:tRNA threonylcarbamoyl adenosine modification protein YeaZ